MSNQKPELKQIKMFGKPLKIMPEKRPINSPIDKKLKMKAVTAFWPKKESEDDGLPKS